MSRQIDWHGTLLAIQPRIRLMRSFDQRSHSYLGYALCIQGTIGEEDERAFTLGIGESAQKKHQLQVGDTLSGRAEPVADPRLEPVEFYKASGLKIIERSGWDKPPPPPWLGVPPELSVYRKRGHRRLDATTYATFCSTCIWGCPMPVEIVIDPWDRQKKEFRMETFCYGPKSCLHYRSGPTRRVPGRRGMVWEEEDWVDEQATTHREDDE